MAGGIQVKRFHWVKFRSAWEQNQAWKEKRRAMREDFDAINSVAASTLANAQINLATGLATLAAQASIQRAQETLAAKKAALLDKLA